MEDQLKYIVSLNEQKADQVLKTNFIWYFLYFTTFLVLDLTVLFVYQQSMYLILSKLCSHVIIILLIFYQNGRLIKPYLNYILLSSKFFTLATTFIFGEFYFQIFLLIIEEQELYKKNLQTYIGRMLLKIGFLILMITNLRLLDILIGISLLLLEIVQFLIFCQNMKKKDEVQERSNQVQFQSSRDTNITNENSYIGVAKLLISEQKIIHKNQSFCKLFYDIGSDNELDELVMEKLTFQIVSQNLEEESNQLMENSNSRMNRHLLNQGFSFNPENSQQLDLGNQKQITNLKKILQDHQIEKQKTLSQNNSKTLEFYIEYQQINKISIFTGDIIITNGEDQAILTLVDITKYNKFQEKKIKEQFKTTIVQSFSHELRTPLNSSLNFLQYCEYDKTLSEEIKKNFILPAINALRLQSYLINDIIDFSSLCSDNLELDITNVTIQQIIDELNKLFKSILEMKNLAFYVDLTSNDTQEIGTDYSRLIQILANLLQNSIKYSSQGMIIVKLTSPALNYIKISIKDEGLGIDQQNLKKIRRLLQNVEEKKNFSDFESWHGFGLLISSMLIQKLKPDDQKSLQIKSEGRQKGTKVKFFIRNYITPNQLSSLCKEQSKRTLSSKFAVSLKSGSKHFSMNGSLVQISDTNHSFSNKKRTLQTIFSKKTTHKNVCKSPENSSKSNSFTDIDFELRIGEFHNLHPFLFQENSVYSHRQKQESQNQMVGKIIDYEQIKTKEKQENEYWLKQFLKTRNCTCNKILSVDDEIFNQKSIQFLLKQKGIEVTLAYNGQQALNIVQETQKCSPSCCLFILILMDYQMPVMNGLEVTILLRQLMEESIIPKINIVGLTAFNSKNDIEKCLQSGMSAVLTKPLKIAELFEILMQL